MRFIVDESTGLAVVEYLRSMGHDVLAASETMPQASDKQVLSRAADEKRILITNDKDFGELIFRNNQIHAGVLLFRLKDESSANRVHMIGTVLEKFSDRIAKHFVVVSEKAIRIRSIN